MAVQSEVMKRALSTRVLGAVSLVGVVAAAALLVGAAQPMSDGMGGPMGGSSSSSAVPSTGPAMIGGGAWRSSPVWHDGLVEKATYRASRVIYGEARKYTATFLTNKEQHDRRTWTKLEKSEKPIEVFKHNQIEDVPTPNYTYHFVTTSHFTADELLLTRFDQSSQEWCGTSFRQLMPLGDRAGNNYALTTFSYMPEAGRDGVDLRFDRKKPLVPEDALAFYLRGFPFEGATMGNAKAKPAVKPTELAIELLPTQKTNRATLINVRQAVVRFAGSEDGSYKIELVAQENPADRKSPMVVRGTYWFAGADRLHVMTKYRNADGSQSYDLESQSRIDYWTIKR